MSVDEKIGEFLQSRKPKGATLGKTSITSGQNKEGSNLLYVKASVLEKRVGFENFSYINNSSYYAFDMNGNYVGCVIVSVLSTKIVEMEWWANEAFKNKGNMTILAQDVIKDIFENKSFDNLKVKENFSTSKIESICVGINNDNFASLAVAKKLGFDENGYLHIDDYYKNKDKKPSINI